MFLPLAWGPQDAHPVGRVHSQCPPQSLKGAETPRRCPGTWDRTSLAQYSPLQDVEHPWPLNTHGTPHLCDNLKASPTSPKAAPRQAVGRALPLVRVCRDRRVLPSSRRCWVFLRLKAHPSLLQWPLGYSQRSNLVLLLSLARGCFIFVFHFLNEELLQK